MYDNIGGKIKWLSKLSFWILSAVFTFWLLFVSGAANFVGLGYLFRYSFGKGPWELVTTLLCFALGEFLIWVSTVLLYGFGQLVENSDDLVAYEENIVETQKQPWANYEGEDEWKCSCGRVNADYITTCVCGKSKREAVAVKEEA